MVVDIYHCRVLMVDGVEITGCSLTTFMLLVVCEAKSEDFQAALILALGKVETEASLALEVVVEDPEMLPNRRSSRGVLYVRQKASIFSP